MLKIYNTLARDKQEFVPLVPGRVGMYVCGMTVYDYCHLGHARVMVVFDMVYRWLKASGYRVDYVRNITDIDDKIIKRAAENGESIHALTARFIAAMHEDADALGVLRPDHEPRATRYVPEMLDMIGKLEANGLAYRAEDGDVNYAVRKFPGYGKLSGKSLEDLRAGERVEVADSKHDPLDFVLWKHAREQETDEVKWDSPWGKGRPGWHIECSAMGASLLGDHFDIHGGGADLQFPHHENEIAQSEGAHRCTFVNYWMHNGFVNVDKEKMSKSLGNFFTIREVLKKYDAEVVRFFILRAHYRSPLNYSDAHLDDAKGALTRLYTALKCCPLPTCRGEQAFPSPDKGRAGRGCRGLERTPCRNASRPRWTTTSTRRMRWPCCSTWPTKNKPHSISNWPRRTQGVGRRTWPAAARSGRIPAGRRNRKRAGRCGNQRANPGAHRGQTGQELCRGGPYPQGVAGGGDRAGRQRLRHDLAARIA